ncbi:MAG: cysteine--tRNA ligase [Oscillospiraceae bacterium]|nr:cysteine--tRNA ligase [Oscillospiraceae bacterium]
MKIYNTLTRQKEQFVPLTEGKVKMYACGPTVYNFIHIGNARPLVLFDTFRRYLEWSGYDVTFVQNFTDIDDKIINKANEESTTYDVIAERYIEEFWKDAKGLGVKPATIHPKATENIGEIISIIEALIEKGNAYQSGGDVYFSTETFSEYGKLSRIPLEDLLDGASERVSDSDNIKKSSADFAVWKSAKEGEPYWDSPWGKGRPGWHIECSAMSRRYLGDTIDIHCGGQDLIFPHHENEIAQSECCNGVPFARYWMHNGFITVDNAKMSKSLGNFFTVRDVAEQFSYEPIRLMMLASHYRSPINYSFDVIKQNKSALERLYTCLAGLRFNLTKAEEGGNENEEGVKTTLLAHREHFKSALEDDFNTADALSSIFDLTKDINTQILSNNGCSRELIQFALDLFLELTGVLGLMYEEASDSIDDKVEQLIAQRLEAKKAKNFAEADRIRDLLKADGIILEDTPQGVKWRKA